jgi:5-methylcytosine-specific restriction endonuclease McrA
MSRSVPEWIGRDDDQRIPDYVKDRVANKAELYCQHCRRQVGGKLRAEFDHETPLILGGQNRESNIQLLCHECHRAKTKLDVKLKAKVARARKRHIGIKRRRRTIPGRKFDGTPIPSRWVEG